LLPRRRRSLPLPAAKQTTINLSIYPRAELNAAAGANSKELQKASRHSRRRRQTKNRRAKQAAYRRAILAPHIPAAGRRLSLGAAPRRCRALLHL